MGDSALVGLVGEVVTRVRGRDEPGEVRVLFRGAYETFIAYADQPIFISRYLSYTTLGGAILLAYWATRDRSREVRLGVSAAVVLSVYLTGFLAISRGYPTVGPVPAFGPETIGRLAGSGYYQGLLAAH